MTGTKLLNLAGFVFVFGLAVACSSKTSGVLMIDGEKFSIDKCRSGQAFGFAGIQFNGDDGRRLRVFSVPDGTAEAALFPKGSDTGDRLGPCGTLVVKQQNSTINNVKNVKGRAKLSCNAAGHEVAGELTFENCH